MKSFIVALLVALALIATACGGGDGGDEAAPADTTEATTVEDEASEEEEDSGEDEESAASVDDCPVDPDDVAAAFPGVDFGETVADSEDSCSYVKSDESGAVAVAVSTDGKAAYQQIKASFGSQAEDLDDVGDAAIWVQGNTSLHALDGDTYVLVQLASVITDFSDGEEAVIAKLRSGAIDVAKAAIDNL